MQFVMAQNLNQHVNGKTIK